MKNNFTYERVGDVFMYSMKTSPHTIHKVVDIDENNSNVIEEFIDGELVKVNINVPKKKVVLCEGELIEYHIAVAIMNSSYIKKHTVEIDNVELFEETHKKAYNILNEKGNINNEN